MTPLQQLPATRTPVKVTRVGHPREGQVGVTLNAEPTAGPAVVLFDVDQAQVAVDLADLAAL